MRNNPFHYLLPVEPKDFVGRWPMVNSIASDLTQINGDSYAVIAGRRCGKSSLLNAIAHQLRRPETTDAGDFIVIPITVDFKALAETIESAEDIYAHLLKEIYSLVAANTSFRPPDAWHLPAQLTEKHFLGLTEKSAISLRDFQACIGYILDQLDAWNQHVRLVLLLDEIDNAIDRPWTQALFSQLRSLKYSSSIKSRIRLVVTGSHHLLGFVSMHGSPLWNVLKLNYLEPFDESGFKELIGRSEGLPEEAAAAIWQQSGGHPFLAQYLLYHIWNQGIHLAKKSNVDEIAGKFLTEQVNDIRGWARAIDVGGLEAYRILSSINGWVGEREIMRSINSPSLDVKIGLTALCYHGFVLHDRGWSNYMRSGDLFKKWYDIEGTIFTSKLADQRTLFIQTVSSAHKGKLKGLTWLHLSDWHQKGHQEDTKFDREVVLDALLKDIEGRSAISPLLEEIDFIIFSGDVAYSGLHEEYEVAIQQLFNPLLEKRGVSRDRLFIVPGNHDLDRTAFELLPTALLQPLKSEGEVQCWLNDTRKRERLLDPFKAFNSFVTAYTGQDHPDFANVRRLQVRDKSVTLFGINSAWMCGRNKDAYNNISDKNVILVGESQIYPPLKLIFDDEIKIAIQHHPLDWLAEFDYNRVEGRLLNECDFILCGHQHKPSAP